MQTTIFLFYGKREKVSFLIINKRKFFVPCNYCHEINCQNNVVERSLSHEPLVP